MDHHVQRRDRLTQQLVQEGVDAFLISHPINVTYLTGFSGDSSFLVLTRGRAVLVSDKRFTEQIAEECPGLEASIRPPSQTVQDAVMKTVSQLGARSVGFESGHLCVSEFETLRDLVPSITWKAGRERVEQIRTIKDAAELAELREAVRFAESAFQTFTAKLKPDDNEKDLSDAMESYIRQAGGKCSSFSTIVASGERAALAHAPPTARQVGDAEMLLVDWGASGRFYKSDLTRVLATRRISPKLESIYAVVLKAQEQALRAVRPGAKAHDIDAEARSVIEQEGFGEFFGHGLGHGLGLQVHEAPAIRQNSQTVLQPGMVFTIEPGIYLPGWGGVRLEDDVLVTPDGSEVLTHVSKELRAVFR